MRGLYYWVGGSLFTVLAGFVFYTLYFLSGRKPGLPCEVTRFWSRVLVSHFFASDVVVRGEEYIERGSSYIIVSNHRSYIDILVAQAALKIPFRWLAKSELFKIPVFGPAMKILGHIPVERNKAYRASSALVRAEEALRGGASVWVFPEGTRTPRGELGSFKRGAFLMALRTGAPLLPVAIVGSDDIFEGPLRITPAKVRVIVTPPVSVRGLEKRPLSFVMDEVRHRLQREFDRAAAS